MAIFYNNTINNTTGLSVIAIDMLRKQKELIDNINNKYDDCCIVVNNKLCNSITRITGFEPAPAYDTNAILHLTLTFKNSYILIFIVWIEHFTNGWNRRVFEYYLNKLDDFEKKNDDSTYCSPLEFSKIDDILDEINKVVKTL